jgi:hypothetical protein
LEFYLNPSNPNNILLLKISLSKMTHNLAAFRNFSTWPQAKELETLLNKNDIKTVLADNISVADLSFSGNTLLDKYEIKIKSSDFEKAEAILEKEAEDIINKIDPNYYLISFTNEELYGVLLKPDEWSIFDYKLAQKILTNRGKILDLEMLSSLKKDRLKILAKPEENQRPWIIAGYLFALFGGGLGIIIGYSLWKSKKTLPNGERLHTYNQKDRISGKKIFFISIIAFPLAFTLNILNLPYSIR